MLGVTDLWTYLAATVLIILLPGPNSMYVLSVAARRGVRYGYRAAGGVFVGDTILMAASAAGVASLLQTSPWLFAIVKYAGAAYLAYLGITLVLAGIRTWRERGDRKSDRPENVGTEKPFHRALIASLLNPKAIIFFVAFFIQFVDPAYPYPALSFVFLGAIVQICSMSYLSALIFSGDALANVFRRRRKLSSISTGGVGAAMLGFAARLTTAGLP